MLFEDRIEIVRSIKYVDAAIPQESLDKFEMWKKIRFDVLFVGDDWYNSERWQELEKNFKKSAKIGNIYWEDVDVVTDELMIHKGAPIHSIDTQIYIAAKKVLSDGFTKFIFGENADIIFGGMDGLLAKDWLFGEFVDRYSYVLPYKVLRNPVMPLKPFQEFEVDGLKRRA